MDSDCSRREHEWSDDSVIPLSSLFVPQNVAQRVSHIAVELVARIPLDEPQQRGSSLQDSDCACE